MPSRERIKIRLDHLRHSCCSGRSWAVMISEMDLVPNALQFSTASHSLKSPGDEFGTIIGNDSRFSHVYRSSARSRMISMSASAIDCRSSQWTKRDLCHAARSNHRAETAKPGCSTTSVSLRQYGSAAPSGVRKSCLACRQKTTADTHSGSQL